jgi:quercetin dioxygenase-like cupin family protein
MTARKTARQLVESEPSTEQLGGPLPTVLQPEDGISFWRPRPANGYVTVKTSPSYGGPDGITMGTQVIPPGCRIPEHSHDRQVEILFCYAGAGHIVVDGVRHPFAAGTTVIARPWMKHEIVNSGGEELRMTWTMVPPGLETFFRKIGRQRMPGDPAPAPFDPPKSADEIQRETGFGDLQKRPR